MLNAPETATMLLRQSNWHSTQTGKIPSRRLDLTRELNKQLPQQRQREAENDKAIDFMSKTSLLHVHHAFWYLTFTARPPPKTS